jgi:hypothetical protein
LRSWIHIRDSLFSGIIDAVLSLAQLSLLLTLAGGVLVLACLAAVVARWPGLGFGLLTLHVVSLWEFPVPPALATVSDLTIYPTDLLIAIFAVAAIVKVRDVGYARAAPVWCLVVALSTLSFSVLAGVQRFGLGATLNEARPILSIIAATVWVWAQSADIGFPPRIHRFLVGTVLGLILVAIWHISIRGLGTADDVMIVDGQVFTSRPLVAAQACFLALAGLYLLLAHRAQGLAWLCFLFVLLTQHRSVWITTLAAFSVVIMRSSPKVRANVLVGVFLAVLSVGFLLAYGAFPGLNADLARSAHSTKTFADRTLGWSTLLAESKQQGISSMAFGQPTGSGWDRLNAGGQLISYSPHNWYVTLYLRIGLIGVGAVIVLLVVTAIRLMKNGRTIELVWITALAVYAVPYNLQLALTPFLAVALARVPMLRLGADTQTPSANTRPRTERRGVSPRARSVLVAKGGPENW